LWAEKFMALTWSPRKRQIILILAYALVFPVTSLLQGAIATIGLIVTLPFLPIAWIGGMAMVGITGFEASYLAGVFVAIFLQVWLVMAWRSSVRKKRISRDRDPL
jgi:asparagine N-glycosylation enzyme membrane subunit Stt3